MQRIFLFILCLATVTLVLSSEIGLQSNEEDLHFANSVKAHPLFGALIKKVEDAEAKSLTSDEVSLTSGKSITSAVQGKEAALSTRDSILDVILDGLASLLSSLIPLVTLAVTLAQAVVSPLVLLVDYLADLSFIQYLEPLPTVILVAQTVLNITSLTLSSLSEENLVSLNSIILSFIQSLFE